MSQCLSILIHKIRCGIQKYGSCLFCPYHETYKPSSRMLNSALCLEHYVQSDTFHFLSNGDSHFHSSCTFPAVRNTFFFPSSPPRLSHTRGTNLGSLEMYVTMYHALFSLIFFQLAAFQLIDILHLLISGAFRYIQCPTLG